MKNKEDAEEVETGDEQSEYHPPQANPDDRGDVVVDFMFESYRLSPEGSESLAEQLKAAARDAREHED